MQPTNSLISRTTQTLTTFLALYFTTLFSLDAWAAARASPHRAPGSSNSFHRPAATTGPEEGSYQAGMHGRGNAGPGSGGRGGGGGRGVGRVAQARDSRPAIKMGGTASCGACLI